MIIENTHRRLISAGILLQDALKPGISNSFKSSYFRSASIILCTIVEGLCYELVKELTASNNHIINTKTENKEIYKIPATIFNNKNDFCICEKIKTDIYLEDKNGGSEFGKLIIYLKNNQAITKSQYKLLDWVRKERNKIHIQGLNTRDTGYTKHKIDKIGLAISLLLVKLKNIT